MLLFVHLLKYPCYRNEIGSFLFFWVASSRGLFLISFLLQASRGLYLCSGEKQDPNVYSHTNTVIHPLNIRDAITSSKQPPPPPQTMLKLYPATTRWISHNRKLFAVGVWSTATGIISRLHLSNDSQGDIVRLIFCL